MKRRQHLVMIMRQPHYGVGKRRLAKGAGNMTAWRFAKASLRYLTQELSQNPRWHFYQSVTPKPKTTTVFCFRQKQGSLGQKLQGIAHLFARKGKLIIIGADCPFITRKHIQNAFKVLVNRRIALGATPDGGFWMIGFKNVEKYHRLLASPHIRWSSAHTLRDLLALLPTNAAIAWQPLLRDIDTAEDLTFAKATLS